MTWVAATPPRRTGSASSIQPVSGSRSSMACTSATSAPASIRLPSAMSPATPAKQWNQARVLVIGPSSQHPRHRAGGAVAVVDADHGDPRRAGGVHGEQGGHAFERSPVPHRGGHGNDGGGG